MVCFVEGHGERALQRQPECLEGKQGKDRQQKENIFVMLRSVDNDIDVSQAVLRMMLH